MNIHIFYTHYNVSGKGLKYRPHWFDYEDCFKNLLSTIKDHNNIKLNVIMDGKIKDNWISKYQQHYTTYEVEGGDMVKAGHAMFNLLKNIKDTIDDKDLIYILENDYLHIEGWVEKIIDLFSSYKGLSYVSLYDHLDKYNVVEGGPDHSDLVSKIIVTDSHHWRTTPSACGSYVVPKTIFFEDVDDQIREVGDHNKWVYLQEHKSRFLLSPIPGLSTHCMDGLLSPTIEWNKI